MSTTTLTRTVTLESTTCASCDITFAVPDTFLYRRRADGQNFYCPNGHSLSFRETEADRLRAKLTTAQKVAENARAAQQAAYPREDDWEPFSTRFERAEWMQWPPASPDAVTEGVVSDV